MISYLLDTNILSDLIRNPRGRIVDRLGQVGETCVATSIIVAAEMRYGAAKKASPRLIERVDKMLARLSILAFEHPMDQAYGDIRQDLEARGQLIGGNDLLIAAQAKTLGLCLVTANVREFSRVADLRIENWLEDRS